MAGLFSFLGSSGNQNQTYSALGEQKQALKANLRSVSRQEGVNYDYMIKTAQRESSLNPKAKAKTSSAAGLFQFTEQTWLKMIKDHGHEFGLHREAAQIAKEPSGRLSIRHPKAEKHVLNLRYNAEIASQMAAKLTQYNAESLRKGLGRAPSNGELYIAHFLGAGGAIKLIENTNQAPQQRADRNFASAARANKAIFYDKNGRARSHKEVYENLTQKFDQGISIQQREKILAAHNGQFGATTQKSSAFGVSQNPDRIFQNLFIADAQSEKRFMGSSQIPSQRNQNNRFAPTHAQQNLFQDRDYRYQPQYSNSLYISNSYADQQNQNTGYYNAQNAKNQGQFYNQMR